MLQLVLELNNRLQDELRGRLFLGVSVELSDYYIQDRPLFGAEVEEKFSSLSEDIAEAGKCVALGRATACVFHLMRVMEGGLQRLGAKLGVPLSETKNWQNILNEINKAIRSLDHKDSKTVAYAEAAAHLYNVKVAWRNEVMHPKQSYTIEEARAILVAVKTFICDLAGLI